jgi:predicted dehydrogenase
MNLNGHLNIGIIGAGSFAAFSAKAFLKLEGIRILAVSDINVSAGSNLAQMLNADFYCDYEFLLKDNNIDLIYIATPPFLHFEISEKALRSGKHVICEKPAGLKTIEAEQLQLLAKKNGLLYVVNLMQRYNPLYNVVSSIINENILGSFLHGYFENYASDQYLGPDHWFWDQSQSGGIFIEHGVHFFDMFYGWLGKGNVISAIQILRPDSKLPVFDRVQAVVNYSQGIVNFYHGFDQPKILDRQEMRLQFEKGDITLYEWIPVRMKLYGLVQTEQKKKLNALLGLPSNKQDVPDSNNSVRGRNKLIVYNELVSMEYGSNSNKEEQYRQMLADMLADQWSWIRNKKHIRIIDDYNAVESLRMAEAAQKIALKL